MENDKSRKLQRLYNLDFYKKQENWKLKRKRATTQSIDVDMVSPADVDKQLYLKQNYDVTDKLNTEINNDSPDAHDGGAEEVPPSKYGTTRENVTRRLHFEMDVHKETKKETSNTETLESDADAIDKLNTEINKDSPDAHDGGAEEVPPSKYGTTRENVTRRLHFEMDVHKETKKETSNTETLESDADAIDKLNTEINKDSPDAHDGVAKEVPPSKYATTRGNVTKEVPPSKYATTRENVTRRLNFDNDVHKETEMETSNTETLESDSLDLNWDSVPLHSQEEDTVLKLCVNNSVADSSNEVVYYPEKTGKEQSLGESSKLDCATLYDWTCENDNEGPQMTFNWNSDDEVGNESDFSFISFMRDAHDVPHSSNMELDFNERPADINGRRLSELSMKQLYDGFNKYSDAMHKLWQETNRRNTAREMRNCKSIDSSTEGETILAGSLINQRILDHKLTSHDRGLY